MVVADVAKVNNASWISMGLTGGILVTAVTLTFKLSVWMTRVEARIEELSAKVENIERNLLLVGKDGWSEVDMIRWTKRLREANPELKIPEPWTDNK